MKSAERYQQAGEQITLMVEVTYPLTQFPLRFQVFMEKSDLVLQRLRN